MAAPKELKSTFRYFLARLKPFGRFIFWGPLGITLLLGLVIWQYLSHPEFRDQPLETDNPTGSNLDSLDINPTDPQADKGADQIPLADPLKPKTSGKNPTAANTKLGSNLQPDFFSQFTQPQKEQPQNQEGSTKAPLSKLFAPLLPPRSSVNPPVIPPTNTTNNNLPDSQVNIEENNPLQKALERQFANPSQTATTPQSLNRNNQPSVSPSQFSNNNYGGQAVPVQPYAQPYQAPYNPYAGQVTQPQIQSYPPAYNPNNNSYNGQAPGQSYQSPNNNPYGGQTSPVYPNQVPPNGNPYGTVSPQIQPSLKGTNY